MGISITETFQFEVPKMEKALQTFQESVKNSTDKKNGLVIDIAAIHVGTTANNNYYSAEALNEAVNTWTAPYSKPIIINHDLNADPIGRVIASSMESDEVTGSQYIKLQAAITNPGAIERVLDQRYLTGSIGAGAESVLCSICDTDWALESIKPGMPPCKHRFGQEYEGVKATKMINKMSFFEYSFVNAPSDKNSIIQAYAFQESWEMPPRLFQLDMTEESISEFELQESNANLDIKPVHVSNPNFLQLKGAYLTAESINNDKTFNNLNTSTTITKEQEKDMSHNDEIIDETNNDHKDNILDSITDSFTKENEEKSVEDAAPEAEPESKEHQEEDNSEERTVSADEESNTEDVQDENKAEEDVEKEAEEAQQSEETNDLQKTNADNKDASGTQEETSNEEAVDDSESTTEEPVEKVEDTEESEEISSDETVEQDDQLSENDSEENKISELQSQINTLKTENETLVDALHRSLVERVVDAKTVRGLVEAKDRYTAVEEHAKRTPSSLIDSLHDLQNVPTIDIDKLKEGFVPKLNATDLEDGENLEEDEAELTEAIKSPEEQLEDHLVEVLLGNTGCH